MAKLHVATLSPSKLELLTAWLVNDPRLGHLTGAGLEIVGAYRFDDPAGEVGIECHLLRAPDGSVVHVPVTYRAEPVESLTEHLIGTLDHSVLGTRWVYDGCADAVYVSELLRTILTGGTEVELVVHGDEGTTIREPNARVTGTGDAGAEAGAVAVDGVELTTGAGSASITAAGSTVHVRRIVDPAEQSAARPSLLGTWIDQPVPTVLAVLG